jgi:hypothetical protein
MDIAKKKQRHDDPAALFGYILLGEFDRYGEKGKFF